MSQPSPPPFLRDPITVPRKELIEHYRAQAARYKQLAERQQRSSVYEGLLSLARQCDAMADALVAPTANPSAKPGLSKEELLLMLDQVVAEAKEQVVPVEQKQAVVEEKTAAPAAAAVEHPRPPALLGAAQELSLDEILQKVQRDIAEGRPAAG